MPSSLWRSVNYKTPIKYFVNTYIREYDLSKANINSLLYTGRITQEELQNYLVMDKQDRERSIGLWIREDSSIYKDIQKGIIEAKRKLVYSNNIEDYEIVSVKNDAMFIVGRELHNTEFPPFKFNMKNVFSVYLQLQELEVYYGDFVDPMSGIVKTNIDVKGISDNVLLKHQGGMFDLICDACYRLQRENIKDTMSWISDFYEAFINRRLDKNYYREFNSISNYRINTFTQYMTLDIIEDSLIPIVDINRNLLIIRDLMSIISDIYRNNIKR